MITRGGEVIELFTRFEPTLKGPPVYFTDEGHARAFVNRFFHKPANRSRMRTALAEVVGRSRVERMADAQIIEALAETLAIGRIWAVRVRLASSAAIESVGQSPPPPTPPPAGPPPPPSTQPVTPPPPRTSEPAVSPAAASAQAAALQQAAASGTPLCEH